MFRYLTDLIRILNVSRNNILYSRIGKEGRYFWSKSRQVRKHLRSFMQEMNRVNNRKVIYKARFGGIWVPLADAHEIYEHLMHNFGYFIASDSFFGVIIDT